MSKLKTLTRIRTVLTPVLHVLIAIFLMCIGYIVFLSKLPETKTITHTHMTTGANMDLVITPKIDSAEMPPLEKGRIAPFIDTENNHAIQDKTCVGNSLVRCRCLIRFKGVLNSFCMPLKTGAVAVTFDPKTDHIASIAQKHGNYLHEIQKIVLREIQLYGKRIVLHAIDIGANVGMFSLMMASLGHKVIAFEPFSGNFERLRLSIMANQFEDRIIVHKLALGSQKSEAYIMTEKNTRIMQTDGIVVTNMSDPMVKKMIEVEKIIKNYGNTNFEKIKTDSLDAFYLRRQLEFNNQSRTTVDIIKIDVEGFESLVVCGGIHFFSQVKPKFIFMEINTRLWNMRKNMFGWKSISEVLIYFKGLGYCVRSVAKYAKDRLTPCANIGDVLTGDVIFTL